MAMNDVRAWIRHPAIRTGVSTAIAYGIILAVLLIAVFLVPYAIFVIF